MTYTTSFVAISVPVDVLCECVEDTTNTERRLDDIGREFANCVDIRN